MKCMKIYDSLHHIFGRGGTALLRSIFGVCPCL